jgi:hypothetical protein
MMNRYNSNKERKRFLYFDEKKISNSTSVKVYTNISMDKLHRHRHV